MMNHPNVQKPFSVLNDSAGISQITFSNNSNFGFNGMAFISEFGKIENNTGNNNIPNITNATPNNKTANTTSLSPISSNASIAKNTKNYTNNLENNTDSNFKKIKGQKSIIFDPQSKKYIHFLSLKKADPSFRPLDVKFSPDGNSLYITSF